MLSAYCFCIINAFAPPALHHHALGSCFCIFVYRLICLVLTIVASLMHFHLLHCIIMLSAHAFAYLIGPVEPELGEPMEQVQAEDLTNLALDQGKPWCIKPILIVFYFESCFMFYYDCALNL
jgi:hypothetical protein